ncbi:hypothetical protein ACMAZF_05000 [Psychrobium sp. nBUS_13]|uniref:hypothetical protein n=1 Tax=Psychrobium sp. nBUS_13 TaxID=3395319 RepID=UPI003EBD162D
MFELIGIIVFVALSVIGYKKNNRNIMLTGSMCLLVALAAPEFVAGFIEGYNGSLT